MLLLQKDAIIDAAASAKAALAATTLPESALVTTAPKANALARTGNLSGIPPSLADDLKAEGLSSENVTFVLQNDMNATFFFVEDDPKRNMDPARADLLNTEENVRSLFHHLLFRPACRMREEIKQWGNSCAKRDENREQVVIDVGCNRGYYSLMAATYGSRVYAFDPQPHCTTLLSASVFANGLQDLVKLKNAFLTNKTGETIEVRRGAGCSSTFRNDNHYGYADAFGKALDPISGANLTVTVGGVSLDDLFDADRHDVLLLKVDVEWFLSHALASGKKLLERGAVRNIVLDFNLSMITRHEGSLEVVKDKSMHLVRQLMDEYRYKSKGSHKGNWEMQEEMRVEDWETLLSKEESKPISTDAWFYK
ncbi:S-adenosyl-L-methionine-dependent methyltransferase [Gracilaria domingensis]|nr:S-adenosyl-L-methionine-dependent methyltransferase [Gracilaria domingensis]